MNFGGFISHLPSLFFLERVSGVSMNFVRTFHAFLVYLSVNYHRFKNNNFLISVLEPHKPLGYVTTIFQAIFDIFTDQAAHTVNFNFVIHIYIYIYIYISYQCGASGRGPFHERILKSINKLNHHFRVNLLTQIRSECT